MDRIINVKVGGNYLNKDSKNAGVRGEANVTKLRITFDEGWDGYAKTVTFFDARGANPVKRIQGIDLLEDIITDTRTYITPIPQEPLAIAGELTFIIDGYLDGKRQRSVSDTLVVKDSPDTDNAGEPTDPTPTQAEQLQSQIDAVIGDIQNAAASAQNAAVSEANAIGAAQSAEMSKNAAQDAASTAEEHAAFAEKQAERAEQSADDAENSRTGALTAQKQAEIAISHNPLIIDGYWYVWSAQSEEYINTEVKAQAGSEVYIGANPPPEADVWIDPDGEGGIYNLDIGIRTPEGGTILGDLINNYAAAPFTTATGNGCIAGMKGYYYSSVEFGDAIDEKNYGPCVITLSDKQWEAPAQAFEIGYSVGDVISMVNNSKYPDCATITAIDKNVITVDKLPFKAIVDMIKKTGSVASDDYSVFVAEKPLAGDVPLGYGAFTSGEGAIALERAAAAFGRLTKALGQYSFAANRETIAAYCAAAFGHFAAALGQASFAVNKNTTAKENYSFAAGLYTSAAAVAQAVFGQYNIEDIAKEFLFIIGNGTSDTKRSNAFTIDRKGNAWHSGGIKIGGVSQSDPEAKDVATTDYVDECIKGYVSEKVLRSLFATFKAVPLVAGITSELSIKLLYDADADSFDIMVNDMVLNNKTPINGSMRIATELLNAENTYIVFYSGENIVYKCSVMSTIPNFGILFAI